MSTTDRKRVSIACTSCRKRKRRCDGQKPVCGLCERESRECEYTHHLEKRKPPTKCYIHALHARIALLEDQLAQYRRSTNDKPTPQSILEDPQSHPPSLPQKISTDLPFYGPESRSSSAYGHLSLLRKSHEGHYTSQQKITIVNGVLLIDQCPFFFEHGLQDQLLEEFWTWQNTWPLLIHEPLFRKDLFANCANGYCTPTLLAALLALSAHGTDIAHSEPPAFGFKASRTSLLEHAKSSVLDQIECPSLSLVLSAALISQTELLMENIALATQYVGIAIRHAMTLGFHRQNLEIDASTIGPQDVAQARSIAWAGIVMLERHISRILGQASAIRESDMESISVPILPSVEYGIWPALKDSKIAKLTSYSMSNFQFSCDLLQIVTPALDKIYAISGSISSEEKEDQVTKTHVAMSEFYNNLPSPLRLPSTAAKQLPAHVYQFNLLYQALKIMLHRPFIRGHPSMELLHTLEDSYLVHLQSATFSAIRVSYIINSFKNFYPLHRLSPLAIESLVTASHIHLFNSKSKDEKLARRSNSLYDLNLHILKLMTPPGKEYSRATEALASLAQEGEMPSAFDHGTSFTPESAVQPKAGAGDPGNIFHPLQIIPADVDDLNQAMVLEDPSTLSDILLHPEPSFDWLDLPLNDQLLCDNFSDDLWWDIPCDAGHVYCGVNGNYF